MFELNPQMDITAVTDIGPDNRVGIVIDNIYAEPMKVRELADKLERSDRSNFTNHPTAPRAAYETHELRKNFERLLRELLADEEHWGRKTDMEAIEGNMGLMWFLVEFMNEKVIDEDPMRLLPFQTWDIQNPSPYQFYMEIFLNRPKECYGGTNVWNFAGKTSIMEDIKNMYADKDREGQSKFSIRKDVYESKFQWAREMTFGMKFNRAVILPADLLQAPIMQNPENFTDCDRIVQKMFL